jgi:hypothetical protein
LKWKKQKKKNIYCWNVTIAIITGIQNQKKNLYLAPLVLVR